MEGVGEMNTNLEIYLKEYEAIREEIVTTMNNRTQILAFGLATIGVLFNACISGYTDKPATSPFVSSFLFFGIPLISIFVLLLWLGEYSRMQRAGKFLERLEEQINREANRQLLTWEIKLDKGKKHMGLPYFATAGIFIGISFGSFCLGVYWFPTSYDKQVLWVGAMIIHALLFIGFYAYIAYIRGKQIFPPIISSNNKAMHRNPKYKKPVHL
jgi:hypothetical protein